SFSASRESSLSFCPGNMDNMFVIRKRKTDNEKTEVVTASNSSNLEQGEGPTSKVSKTDLTKTYVSTDQPFGWVPDWGPKFKNEGAVKQQMGPENSKNCRFARKMGLFWGTFAIFLHIKIFSRFAHKLG